MMPPESFWFSKDDDYDRFDRNAFYGRIESTKGSSNSTNPKPNVHPTSNSNSQRFPTNLKSKAAITGLPKTKKTTFVDAKNRKAGIHQFPKRSGSVGKSDGSMVEPSSRKNRPAGIHQFPKPSESVGKSDGPRKNRPRVSEPPKDRAKPVERRVEPSSRKNRPRVSEPPKDIAKPVERRKMGFLASFRAIFRSVT